MAVLNGDFDGGLGSWKEFALSLADDVRIRDKRLQERIADVTTDESISAIVSFRGSAHYGISENLSQEGYSVTHTFSEQIDGKIVEAPINKIIKKRADSSDEEISELEWYKAMLGNVTYDYLGEFLPRTKEGDHEALWMSGFMVDQLTDMQAIRRFEGEVKEKGFLEALQEFGQK